MSTVTSADGTTIDYDAYGTGPASGSAAFGAARR
jgi:hypothetical protein